MFTEFVNPGMTFHQAKEEVQQMVTPQEKKLGCPTRLVIIAVLALRTSRLMMSRSTYICFGRWLCMSWIYWVGDESHQAEIVGLIFIISFQIGRRGASKIAPFSASHLL